MKDDGYRIQTLTIDGDDVRIFVSGEDAIEMEFVEQLFRLRRENENAYARIWDLVDALVDEEPALKA